MNKQQRLALFEHVDLYPVTCAALSNGRDNLAFLEGIIQGGARIVQLREKKLTGKAFFDLARRFRTRCTEAGVLLIINDHLDVAMAVDADGVHLGQDDFPLAEARKLAPKLILGASTHNREEALTAQRQGADYFNIGPIYPTETKKLSFTALGPEAIPELSAGIDLPFTVMGGIKAHNLDPLLARGARKVAVVTALTQAEDISSATRALIEAIRTGRTS